MTTRTRQEMRQREMKSQMGKRDSKVREDYWVDQVEDAGKDVLPSVSFAEVEVSA
jgi:hypothetical protein